MTQKIIPSLWFEQEALEAFNNYIHIFKQGTIVESNAIVSQAEVLGFKMSGINGGPHFKPNPSISFMAVLDNENAINEAWNAITKNGEILMPLDEYPWSARYGWCIDNCGVSWQLYLGNVAATNHQRIVPHLLFTQTYNGKCLDAVSYYKEVFKSFESNGVLYYSEESQKHLVQHTQFIIEGVTLSAADGGSVPHSFSFNEGVSFIILCENQEEIDYYWERLSKHGKESMCGWCCDQFGVWWQIIPKHLPELMAKSNANTNLMKMKKIIIEDF